VNGRNRSRDATWGLPRLGRAWALAVALTAMCAECAESAEFYYAIIFGSQSQPKKLKYTHTWATFVRAVGEGTDPNNYALTVHTISWLPQTLQVRVLRPWPEPGVNLDLDESFAAVSSNGEHVIAWGPFLIRPELYAKSIEVYNVLESGVCRYRAIDGPADLLISDCIHAVAAVDPEFGRTHYPLIRIGIPASRYISRQIMQRSVYDQKTMDNSWLIPRIGLDRYCVEIISPQQMADRGCPLCNRRD
jgi:hypothetical protein